jgi:hypothetical protein
MDDEFLDAIGKTADTSFDASVPADDDANCTGTRCAKRPSGIEAKGFIDGERKGERIPFEVMPTRCPPYLGPPTGRVGSADEKRGAYHLQDEYLAGRLGKNEYENGRLWNTAKWIELHYRIFTLPAEALPPFNIYVCDEISQSTEGTGAPTGLDDEAPDPKDENEGVGFESINVGEADSERSMCVKDEDGTTRRLEIKADDYAVLRLADALEEIDKLAKIDVNKLMREVPPLPQIDSPDLDQRVESDKIIRMLMVGMRTLWHPVIRAIADRVTMKSLGKSQGVDNDKAASVAGRWRVIEGLRAR